MAAIGPSSSPQSFSFKGSIDMLDLCYYPCTHNYLIDSVNKIRDINICGNTLVAVGDMAILDMALASRPNSNLQSKKIEHVYFIEISGPALDFWKVFFEKLSSLEIEQFRVWLHDFPVSNDYPEAARSYVLAYIIPKFIKQEIGHCNTWIHSNQDFLALQNIARQNRVHCIALNILSATDVTSFLQALENLNQTIDLLYLSNLPDYCQTEEKVSAFQQSIEVFKKSKAADKATVICSLLTQLAGAKDQRYVRKIDQVRVYLHKGKDESTLYFDLENSREPCDRLPLQVKINAGASIKEMLKDIQSEDLNTPDEVGNTPLHLALKKINSYMLDRKSKPAEIAKEKAEALQALEVLKENVHCLVNAGANLQFKNNEGKTPSDLTLETNNAELISFFKDIKEKYKKKLKKAKVSQVN
jgi:hypothetical protein